MLDTFVALFFMMPPVDAYLCEVYYRIPQKVDAAGDFTWKDKAAAAKRGMDTCQYVVGGMNPRLKQSLYEFGQRADAAGMQWSFSSGFRDDFRQAIANGIKARTGFSMHGGSRVTGGYGDGRAADLYMEGNLTPLLHLFDGVSNSVGLIRPYKGFDPAHVQLVSSAPSKVTRTAKVRTASYVRHKTHKFASIKKHKKRR